jgi:hypothetical protein
MKVEELRIGNKIGFYKPLINELQIGTIQGILFDDDEGILVFVPEFSKKTWLNIEAIKPLDLTEEWLLNLRFKFSTLDRDFRLFPTFETQIIADVIDGFASAMFYTKTIHTEYKPIYLPITSVHKLQNLYFALVGEELVLQD